MCGGDFQRRLRRRGAAGKGLVHLLIELFQALIHLPARVVVNRLDLRRHLRALRFVLRLRGQLLAGNLFQQAAAVPVHLLQMLRGGCGGVATGRFDKARLLLPVLRR